MKRSYLILFLLLFCAYTYAQETEKKTSKGLLFFYRTGNWVDNYLRKGIDTSYIDLPEHSWRVALTGSTLGINSTITSSYHFTGMTEPLVVAMYNRTTPSVNLGFNVGYRGFGFGYSWDLLHAYAQQLSFSFGSKFIGLDFSLQTSTNISTSIAVGNWTKDNYARNNVVITNANLNFWYALNAKHYSHQAAIKQSYIQKKTAGSLLLHLAYQSSQISLSDTLKIAGDAQRPLLPSLMSGMTGMTTRQVAVGIGYGINYTPNHGKVVLHASAAAMLVTYSVNHISYYIPDSVLVGLPDREPMFKLASSSPVHVTGNVRAAVSWEINKWVHLSAWATGDHIRFKSKPTANNNIIELKNWNWKAQLTVAVRFGAGRDRVQRALGNGDRLLVIGDSNAGHKKSRLPLWLTDYFWSPKD